MGPDAAEAPSGKARSRRIVPVLALSAVAFFGLFLFGNAVHQLSLHRPLWSGVYLAAAVVLYVSAIVVARRHYGRPA